jgi:hypothetical protein
MDFRQVVVSHTDFLQKEALNLEACYDNHSIFLHNAEPPTLMANARSQFVDH